MAPLGLSTLRSHHDEKAALGDIALKLVLTFDVQRAWECTAIRGPSSAVREEVVSLRCTCGERQIYPRERSSSALYTTLL